MIYFTGDIHGSVDIRKLNPNNLRCLGITLNKDDHLILLGDIGLPFYPTDTVKGSPTYGEYRFWTRFLAWKKCTILFVDGNHDNHDFWREQPVTEWHGGRVHRHPHIPNALHLMRGEIYDDVDGKSIFSFGGAASHDVEPVYIGSQCVWKGRKEGISWWRHETADESETENARRNLARHDNRVDCIVTHTPPFSVVNEFFPQKAVEKDTTAKFLDTVLADVQYDMWLCGHIHTEYIISEMKLVGLYNDIQNYDDIYKALAELKNND